MFYEFSVTKCKMLHVAVTGRIDPSSSRTNAELHEVDPASDRLGLPQMYINITIQILDIIHRPVFI
jgi:hypothetical protein